MIVSESRYEAGKPKWDEIMAKKGNGCPHRPISTSGLHNRRLLESRMDMFLKPSEQMRLQLTHCERHLESA